MSEHSNLDAIAHARFREAFGEPQRTMGSGEQWAFQTVHGSDIHVMVNGTVAGPGVWVFDPNDSVHGVLNVTLKSEAQVDEFIQKIHERVKRAI